MDRGHRAFQPLADSLATEPLGLLGITGLSQHQVVKVQDGSTLALVAQPAVLSIAPGAAAIDEVEDMGTVFLVQFLYLLQSGFYHFVVPRHVLGRSCCGIAYQGVVQVLRAALQPLAIAGAVDIGQVVHLQLLQQLDGLGSVLQDGGHDDHRGVLLRYQTVLELYLKRVLRAVNAVQQLVEKVYYHLACRYPYQHSEQHRQPHRPAVVSPGGKQETDAQCQKHHNPHIQVGA